jgi:hypothetical protein
MARRRDEQWDLAGKAGSSTPKRRKTHMVSDSDADGYSDDESMLDQFNDPQAFIRQFGGYASDEDQVDDEDSDSGKGTYESIYTHKSFLKLESCLAETKVYICKELTTYGLCCWSR